MSDDKSILSRIRALDDRFAAAEKNLHDAQQMLLHVRTEYAAARENLDGLAHAIGFSRNEYPDVSGGGVPYPQLSEEALRAVTVKPPAAIIKAIDL